MARPLRILFDLGNTRLKWRVLQGDLVEDEGHLPVSEPNWTGLMQRLQAAADQWSSAKDGQAIGCRVGPRALAQELETRLRQEMGLTIRWPLADSSLKVQWAGQQFFLEQQYLEPARLGTDRWLAALGALVKWAADLGGAEAGLSDSGKAQLGLVSAGTATVLDRLAISRLEGGWRGQLTGGLIYPGFDLMRLALAQQTADLAAYVEESIGRPLAAGLAIDSVGAVQAGIAAAQAGPMAWAGPLDAVMVHGGQASAWSEALARLDPEGRLVARQAVVQAEDLVFLGLRVLAESS